MTYDTTKDPELDYVSDRIEDIKIVCKGSAFVKKETTRFLPNPVTPTDNKSQQYRSFLLGARLEGWAALTIKTMLGKMMLDKVMLESPSRDYINSDIDGDGMSLGGMCAKSAKNILQAKWEWWIVDYKGLTGVDIDSLSQADYEKINPRPVVKRYTRESMVKQPYYRMVNGRRQLAFLMFQEQEDKFKPEQAITQLVDSYFIIALDDEGYCFQQKIVDGSEGERIYMKANGQRLTHIPAICVSDEEISTDIPDELGFISSIVDIVITKYQNSANKTRFLNSLPPTKVIYTGTDEGFTEEWKEAFNFVNTGDKNKQADLQMGGNIAMPGEKAKIDILSAGGNMQPYFDEDKQLENAARQQGAVISPNDAVVKTATESLIDESTRNAVMLPLVAGIEDAVKWVNAYFAMFEGMVDESGLAEYRESTEFAIDRSFATKKVTPDEVRLVMEILQYPNIMANEDNPQQSSIDAFNKWLKSSGWDLNFLLED